ncbi:cyclophilin-like domain-containing protein [Blastocladiella britannica]|nr:cyclophilin-like domain-containing protein [Blastocladiella britannica]
MSQAYILEPATRGKVVLHTTKGAIDIELWPKECPLATRNFVQLCLDGYYDGSPFHRLVPNFIMQGGDPTGTGHGGESYTGSKLPVEKHQRLSFGRRGLCALADGHSQFFITLDKTPELQGRHSIFGKVVGDTLYNVLDMASSPIDANERPLVLVTIQSADVVDNPFEDMVPRDLASTTKRRPVSSSAANTAANRTPHALAKIAKKPSKRSLALLSFGDEETEHLERPAPKRARAEEPASTSTSSNGPSAVAEPHVPAKRPVSPAKPLIADQKARMATPTPHPPPAIAPPPPASAPTKAAAAPKSATKKKPTVPLWKQERDAQIAGAKSRTRPGTAAAGGNGKTGDVLASLLSFRSKLGSHHASSGAPDSSELGPPCFLHSVPGCLSCAPTSDASGADRVGDDGWMDHRLQFGKDHLGKDVTRGKVIEDDGYIVLDPRAPPKDLWNAVGGESTLPTAGGQVQADSKRPQQEKRSGREKHWRD